MLDADQSDELPTEDLDPGCRTESRKHRNDRLPAEVNTEAGDRTFLSRKVINTPQIQG